MSTNLVPLSKSNLPAYLRQNTDSARTVSTELAGGVVSGFPIISYRGKVWRIRKSGEEVTYTGTDGDPIQSIELVFVKSNKIPSKTYYKGKWAEGESSPPTCWSSDGIKPDANVQEKQNPSCASCPRNAWGSRITEQGKKGRECSDVRRMAVVFADELRRKGAASHLFLMRVPPASLNPLKDYAEKVLGPAGVEYFALVTRVGFDAQASHPKLTFRVATEGGSPRFLTAEEYETVLQLRDSDEVHNILSESTELSEPGTTGGDEGTASAAEESPAPAPTSRKPAAPRPRPIEEEEVEVIPATMAADDDDGDDEGAEPSPPPPPAKKRGPKPRQPAAAAPARENAAPARAPAAPAAAKGGFDDLLDSLLGK